MDTRSEMAMRILAIADLHGNEDVLYELGDIVKREGPDLIVFSGDVVGGSARRTEWTNSRMENREPELSKEIREEMEEDKGFFDLFFKKVNELGPPILCVPGRRDAPKENFSLVAFNAEGSYENVHIIHNSEFRFNGFVFRGFGGEITEELREDNFIHQYSRMDVQGNLMQEGENIILVTHSPPIGAKISKENGSEKGSPIVNDIIERSKAILAFCSHAHEPDMEKVLGAFVVNPGPLYDHNYAVVDVDDKDRIKVEHHGIE